MKITVETNQNIIFFETLLSSNNNKKYHPLGLKIAKEFKDVRGLKAFKQFHKAIQEKRIPSHPWQYIFLSINLNNNLEPKSLSPKDGFGPKRRKLYMESIYPIVSKIHTESNFDERYSEKVLPGYEIVVRDIQKLFNKENPGKYLKSFWKEKEKIKLLFIPNPLRVGGGSSVSRKTKFYSITGTVETDEGVIFKPSHMISNLFHEYSHSFFKRQLFSRKELVKKNKEFCNTLSKRIEGDSREAFKNYGTSTVYFEETFIRAVQLFLSKQFFEEKTGESMKNKITELLHKRKEEGFIYIDKFYNLLESSENPIVSYMKVVEDIVKN
ncbi:MAG: DUF4932 domain-containing protein [Candidatus Dojkabacteria bacterium]